MKNLFKVFAGLAIIAGSFSLTSCEGQNTLVYTNTTGAIYAKGTQTVTISRGSDTDLAFESTISKSNLSLPSELAGKSIDSVTYVDAGSIQVTLSGSLTSPDTSSSYHYYQITINNDGMVGNNIVNATVTVYSTGPAISATASSYNYSTKDGVTTVNASSTYSLPYGNFNPLSFDGGLTLTGTTSGTLTYDASETSATFTVREAVIAADSDYPYVTLTAACTSFNLALKLPIGKDLASVLIYV